jgi:hypothetical protein
MAGSSSKQQGPSYETAPLRHKSIEKKIDPKYKPNDLLKLIRRASQSS